MKRFPRNIAKFVLPLLIIAVALELVVESIPNTYTYNREYMEQYGAQIQTLILGSLNAYDGLNPCVLPHTFNIANSSQTLEDDYRLLAKYIDTLDSLQMVIVGLGYHSLEATKEDHRRTYYTIYMDLYPRWPLSRYSFEVCNPQLLLKKIIKYAGDSLGFGTNYTKVNRSDDWVDSGEKRISGHTFDVAKYADRINENKGYLNPIAMMCDQKKVKLLLVTMPVHKSYSERIDSTQYNLTAEFCDSLVNAYDNVKYINLFTDNRFMEDDFYDADHLCKIGAEELS